MDTKKIIEEGKAVLGIELGSTRIKAVLIHPYTFEPIASGGFRWENQYENGIWTYSLDTVWQGISESYKELKADIKDKYQVVPKSFAALGISAMMHGYLAFDKDDSLLSPFRTWRNTITEKSAEELTKLFNYNIPQRWSIAHLYQCILDNDPHVNNISYITTLSGYVHYMLTGKKVLGVNDASGMFPIDPDTLDYYQDMIDKFDQKVSGKNYGWKLKEVLPKVLAAGENAGALTEKGAALLDKEGDLKAGIQMCPPEGDAGTGMVATNSVAKGTGNVSAGTSCFAMLVLEKALKKVHPEIDMVSTPDGNPCAMAHTNNCTSDIDAWAGLFTEFVNAIGLSASPDKIFSTLYEKAGEGEADLGGLLSLGYLSGENMLFLDQGRPMFLRLPDANFTLSNFMRSHIYGILAALRVGLDILTIEEEVKILRMTGHGGFFKTPKVGQRFMAMCMEAPVAVMKTAGEGGAWGIAVLAAYLLEDKLTLSDFLEEKVFAGQEKTVIEPLEEDINSFRKYMKSFKDSVIIQRNACEHFNKI